MAQKTTKKTTKKKAAPKPRSRTSAAPPKAAAPRKAEKGRNPLYVLVIMGLVTAIALMVNRYVPREDARRDEIKKKAVHTGGDPADGAVEEKDKKKEKDDRKKKDEKAEKKEKIEKGGKPVQPVKQEGADRPDTGEVKVYFVKLNEESEKMYLAPVARSVPRGGLLENTMKELIKGPTQHEKKKGHLTAVPPGLRVNSIRIRNQTAEIDFNGAIEQGASGSILINRIDQIVYTATQFPNVKSVIIKINGKQRQTLGTDGLSIGGPLHRR